MEEYLCRMELWMGDWYVILYSYDEKVDLTLPDREHRVNLDCAKPVANLYSNAMDILDMSSFPSQLSTLDTSR